jgi:Holliday junction resolvase|tara:strand:+ start:811 stop:1083 length:273 start_codon:yes stop_codon:yes gene_type:complete
MLEAPIEKAVCKYAKDKGWLVYKFVSPANRGVPDRIFMKDGEVFFIEFKATGKKPTKLQQSVISKMRDNLMTVYVVDSIEYGKDIIDVIP